MVIKLQSLALRSFLFFLFSLVAPSMALALESPSSRPIDTQPSDNAPKTVPPQSSAFWLKGTDDHWYPFRPEAFPDAASRVVGSSTRYYLHGVDATVGGSETACRSLVQLLGMARSDASVAEVVPICGALLTSGFLTTEEPRNGDWLVIPVREGAGVRLGYLPLEKAVGSGMPPRVSHQTTLGARATIGFRPGVGAQLGTAEIVQTESMRRERRVDALVGFPQSSVIYQQEVTQAAVYQGIPYRTDRRLFDGGVSYSYPSDLFVGIGYEKKHQEFSDVPVTDFGIRVGLRPTGPLTRLTTENARVRFTAMFNDFNPYGLPVSSVVPGIWGVAVTFKGSDTPWILDKASGSWVSYQGTDGLPTAHVGVGGAGPLVLPFVWPGEGAMPDRRIQLPPLAVQALLASDVSKARLDTLLPSETREILASVQRFRSVDSSRQIQFFPAEAGIHVLPRTSWSRYPEIAAAFTKLTGVPITESTTTEEVREAVWRWFSERNTELVKVVSENPQPSNGRTMRSFAEAALALPSVPTPDECRKIWLTERREERQKQWSSQRSNEVSSDPKVSQRNLYADAYDLHVDDWVGFASQSPGGSEERTIVGQMVLDIAIIEPETVNNRRSRGMSQLKRTTTAVTREWTFRVPADMPEAVATERVRKVIGEAKQSALQTAHDAMARAWRQRSDYESAKNEVVQKLTQSGMSVVPTNSSAQLRREQLLRSLTKKSE